jgi:hypothetical protein
LKTFVRERASLHYQTLLGKWLNTKPASLNYEIKKKRLFTNIMNSNFGFKGVFYNIFGGHLTCMKIPLRKEESYYAFSFKV